MSFLLRAMQHLGIYHTPAHIYSLGTSSGKTGNAKQYELIAANPPFRGDMSMIEINHAGSLFIFRISPSDATVVQRRLNKHNAHWLNYDRYDTADEAKRALLTFQEFEEVDDDRE